MRWFEVLSAALFTLDATGSGLAVAVVSAARTLPMLLLGAFAGVMSEAVNRKRVLLIGQIVSGLASAAVAVLAVFGIARPWHVGVAAPAGVSGANERCFGWPASIKSTRHFASSLNRRASTQPAEPAPTTM